VPRSCCHQERANRVEGPASCNRWREGGKHEAVQASSDRLPTAVARGQEPKSPSQRSTLALNCRLSAVSC
jgi:hypothetical protein